jgi:hypothetical protein
MTPKPPLTDAELKRIAGQFAHETPKPREWFINPVVGYKCEINENGIGLTGNEIHVVEHSAYADALAEVEHLKLSNKLLRDQRDSAHCEIELLTNLRDMDAAIIDGMRAILAVSRMVNNNRPDVRMTQALNNYDRSKLGK